MPLFETPIRITALRLSVMVVAMGMAGATVLAGEIAPAGASGGEPILPEFFAGDYVVVGRLPDAGAAYSGTARLTAEGDGLMMQLRIGGETSTAAGRFEVPSPPGEGLVLRFAERTGAWNATCLWQIDLDNYPRLTCYKLVPGVDHTAPGLEAFFPTGAWPETAPGKTFGSGG